MRQKNISVTSFEESIASVAFIHLGCEKNLVDTEHMMGLLDEGGYGISTNPKDASLVVGNT